MPYAWMTDLALDSPRAVATHPPDGHSAEVRLHGCTR